MITLNNIIKILFLLILFSCTKSNNIFIDEKDYFKKSSSSISPKEDYNIDFYKSESFVINSQLKGNNIVHNSLPIPSVVKLYNPDDVTLSIVARNIEGEVGQFNLAISPDIAKFLNVNSKVYVEYLKNESITLVSVVSSQETSIVKLENSDISFESLDDKPTELSTELDIENIKAIQESPKSNGNLIFVDKYNDLNMAKIYTNKIRNFPLIFENSKDKIEVYAGPFKNNDIDLKLDFLIKNGYSNAKINR